MKIAIAADHRGRTAASYVVERLRSQGHEVAVVGPQDEGSVDYPDSAQAVAERLSDGSSERGILICGTGIGVSIAANKFRGIRAALAHDEFGSRLARTHNDANVLCLPADLLGDNEIEKMVTVFLEADFEGGRHARRVNKINELERAECERHASGRQVTPN